MNMYEINKQIMAQIEPIKPDVLRNELADVAAWFGANIKNKYFMMLCSERNDYTVFNVEHHYYDLAASEMYECLVNRGQVISVDYNHDYEYYEIWVRIEEDTFMYIVFPCNDFVIEC